MSNPRRLKILLSAFSCAPRRGSEPAVGWNIARTLAKQHEVWVLTHKTDNYLPIQQELTENPNPNLHFHFYEISSRVKIHEAGRFGEQLNYYLWQIGAFFAAKKLHRAESFDLVQHVTFVRYWTPTFMNLLGAPFVWGPIGGGESSPRSFTSEFGMEGKIFDWLRRAARRLGEFDPFVRLAARRSRKIVAVTNETAARLRQIGAPEVKVISQCALNEDELAHFGRAKVADDSKIRFISIGRLLHWKGFYLGLKAFAEAKIDNAEYLIVGEGPDEKRLRDLAEQLGIANKVRFCGAVSRSETFDFLNESHVLVHPSLHDSGSFACLEALAARRAVICLDLGGPAVIVSEDCGIKINAENPRQAVEEIAGAMRLLAKDSSLRAELGENARRRAVEIFNWDKKIADYNELYAEILSEPAMAATENQKNFHRRDAETPSF